MPESSIEILGHSVGGVTYRHYAHRDPLAFKAIMTIPQPTAFHSLTRGFEGMCCRREFEAANCLLANRAPPSVTGAVRQSGPLAVVHRSN
jgi:hypothetical protein